jgi:hypothetical protein
MSDNHNIKQLLTQENTHDGETSSRGLSSTNKGNESEKQPFLGLSDVPNLNYDEKDTKARLVNRQTGEVILITDEIKQKFRLARMQLRIHSWAMAVNSFGGLKGGNKYRSVMITLTYRPDIKWMAGHINNFMDGVKRVLGNKLIAYAWVAEMQPKRCVPHYHVYLVVKKGAKIPMPDKAYGKRKHKLWPHGSTNIQTAKSPFYLVKYTGKEHQKEGFYRNMRIFAVWIAKDVLSQIERLKFRLSALPKWLANIARPMIDHADYEHPKPSPGGGWLFMDKVLRSEWEYQRLIEGEWVNVSTSLANLQYDDMTDGERDIIDFNDFCDYCKEMEGQY